MAAVPDTDVVGVTTMAAQAAIRTTPRAPPVVAQAQAIGTPQAVTVAAGPIKITLVELVAALRAIKTTALAVVRVPALLPGVMGAAG